MAYPRKGTKGYEEAVKKTRATLIKKYGSEEKAREFFQSIGRKGGKATGLKGFATNPELARIAGAKGGKKSRRKPANG